MSSEGLYKVFGQHPLFVDMSLLDFRRQLADLRDSFNSEQYEKNFKTMSPFLVIITTGDGYGVISSENKSPEASKIFYEARDFYYSRAKPIVLNTKKLDEIGSFLFNNEMELF
jgi:hypothetical protein